MMMRELKRKSYSINYYDTVEDKAEEESSESRFISNSLGTYVP